MSYNEVLMFRNMRRFANYKGYSSTLEFAGSADNDVKRRDIVAIDALKFNENAA